MLPLPRPSLPGAHAWALLLVSLALVPAAAHASAALAGSDAPIRWWSSLAALYAGWHAWAIVGLLALATLAATLGVAIVVRLSRSRAGFALAAFYAVLAAQFVFWTLVMPTEAALANPAFAGDWPSLAARLDLSNRTWTMFHLVAAGALLMSLMSALPTKNAEPYRRRPRPRRTR